MTRIDAPMTADAGVMYNGLPRIARSQRLLDELVLAAREVVEQRRKVNSVEMRKGKTEAA